MGTATGEAPNVIDYRVMVPAVAAGSDKDTPVCVVPFTGTVSAVKYIPVTTLTGANTDSRTLSLQNRNGVDGTGTTAVASQAFTSGNNATAFMPTAIPLSGTPANLNVTQGDVLNFHSLHLGSTGLADPGGLVIVSVSRD